MAQRLYSIKPNKKENFKKDTTMKRLILLTAILTMFFTIPNAKAHFKFGGGFSVFYSSLQSHGEWVNSSYGNVWRPLHVQHGWRPYLHGRWIWTDYGWYWLSSEPFGWATFHYGRWQFDDYYGWIWVPDDVWGPAWVEWRYSDDYIGWSPLPPSAHFNFSVGFSFDVGWNAPMHYWNFVPCRSFTSVTIVDYVQPVERTRRFFGSTRSVRNIEADGERVINRGVDVGFVERRTRTRIERTEVVGRERGEGEQIVRSEGRQRLEVYRPRVEGSVREGELRQQREQRSTNQRENKMRERVTGERYKSRESQTRTEGREETTRREYVPNRRYEVQRNRPSQRETFEQKERLRDNRQTDVNRTYQRQERKEVQRRETQVERRNETRSTERRFETRERATQPQRIERTPEKKPEPPQREPRSGRRRP
ncbi:MAG: hypothetical protein HYZ33_01075 [Ignavibacteriales bacterium]|nr:hypothetical protein [Ignavibacteriales bacterium]